MLKMIHKDILTVEKGTICHQVNCKGVMGAGIALLIRKKWPDVYNQYHKKHIEDGWSVGEIQTIEVEPHLYVCNVAGQNDFGGGLQTDYKAIEAAFSTLQSTYEYKPIYVPFLMGCGLAGGDWKLYSGIIEKHIPDAIVCKIF